MLNANLERTISFGLCHQ